jgi:hypothetical protein
VLANHVVVIHVPLAKSGLDELYVLDFSLDQLSLCDCAVFVRGVVLICICGDEVFWNDCVSRSCRT